MKRKSNFKIRTLKSKHEDYSKAEYENLIKHEGEFKHTDFKKLKMHELARMGRVLREEAFRRADEFEKSGLPNSPAYSRLEERNIYWVRDRKKLNPIGATKDDVINYIIESLTFLDDETSTVQGWENVISKLSKKTGVEESYYKDKNKSEVFWDLYNQVIEYLDTHAVPWKPSEVQSIVSNYMEDVGDIDFSNEDKVLSLKGDILDFFKNKYKIDIEDEPDAEDLFTKRFD